MVYRNCKNFAATTYQVWPNERICEDGALFNYISSELSGLSYKKKTEGKNVHGTQLRKLIKYKNSVSR